jgi:DNA polymerase-3 subunit epsilon
VKWFSELNVNETITLKNFTHCKIKIPKYFTESWLLQNESLVRIGLVVDVETTGLKISEHKIIEIGFREFKFNKETGEILELGKAYSAFEDPQEPLSLEIQKLTGITDEMLKGQVIDWDYVSDAFANAHIIIAHNASFDRPFIERMVNNSAQKIWACSLKQINWLAKGFTIHKLEILGILHGFFIDNAHRALIDAEALLYLLSHMDDETATPYLNELLNNARRGVVTLFANNSPFEAKDFLKRKGYIWDSGKRTWFKNIYKDELALEMSWLEKDIYKGSFSGIIQELKLVDNFK